MTETPRSLSVDSSSTDVSGRAGGERGCPIHIDLPWPPSANSIWKRSAHGIYLDKKYKAWREEADKTIMRQRRRIGRMIEGRFKAVITLDDSKRRKNTDVDNRGKVVLDCLQRMRVIENDANADSVTLEWGPVQGVRVTVTPL